jgi:hypothetical protein
VRITRTDTEAEKARYCYRNLYFPLQLYALNSRVIFDNLATDIVAVNICSCQRVNAQGSEKV